MGVVSVTVSAKCLADLLNILPTSRLDAEEYTEKYKYCVFVRS